MADKLGILINTILNVKQEDLQKQLDSVAKKIKINLKPRIDFDENVIAKFKSDVDKLAKNIKLNLRFDVDKQSVKDAEKTVTETAKEISEKSKSQNKIKVFDKEQLEAEGRQFFISATGIVNRVKNQFKDLGDVNVNFLKNAKNQIVGFEAEIKKLDGTIEKLRFDMAKIKVGDSTQKGFVFSGANLIDKNAGDVLQKNLNILQKFETRLKNIRDSFTSSRGVKEANNLAILNKEYNSILSTIEKLRESHSNLTEEQKRNIDKQINTLNSLYKAYRDIEITAEKGFNFKQFENITGQVIKLRENLNATVVTLKNYKDALSTPLLQGYRLNALKNVQETKEYLKLTQELQKGNEFVNLTAYIDKATGNIYKYSHAARNAMIDTLTWGKAITTAFKRVIQWTTSTTLIFGSIRAFKEMLNIIKKVDEALVDINKVLDLSNEGLKELAKNATIVGKEYGRTTVEVLKATAAFAKAGLDKDTAQNFAKLALLLANVGDMTIESAQETLIAANAGYQLGNSYQSLLSIIDKFNEIANRNATEVSQLSDAWKVSAATAKQAGLSIDEYTALIGTAQSVTQRSGSEIGNAWKTILMRIQGVSDGVDTLEEDVSKAEEALNSIGIAVRKSPNEFRPAMEILEELAAKFNDLSTVEQSYVIEALAGKYRANILKSTLQNFDMVYKQINEAMNSTGSAIKENERYMDSITAKSKQLIAVWEQLSQTIINSDWVKSILDLLISGTETIDNVISQIGLLNTALLVLISTLTILKGKAIFDWAVGVGAIFSEAAKSVGVFSAAIQTADVATVKLRAALLGLLKNPITWLVAIVGVVVSSIIKWSNEQQKLLDITQEAKESQEKFNNALKDFYNTLDPQKINEVNSALTEYNNEVAKAKEELDKLGDISFLGLFSKEIYSVNELINMTNEELKEVAAIMTGYNLGPAFNDYYNRLVKYVNVVRENTKAQEEFNKAQELAKSLDYESVQNTTKKISIKLREIESNKRLFDSYEKVYKKLSEGKSLTEDEIELNNKLINDYPEYTRVLNEKTGALGVNIEALKSNIEAQEALAIIELNSLKETAKAEKLKTQGLIEETDKRIRAIDSEIKTLEARNQAYAALINADDPNALRYEKFYLNNYNRIKEAGKLLAESKKQLETLRATLNAWDTLENLSIDDLRKGVTSTSGFFPEDKDKDKSKSESTEIYEAEINQFQQLEDALAKVNEEIERNQVLTDLAEEKDKINLLSKRIDLYKEEQKILHQLAEARRSVIQQNVEKLRGLGFDVSYDRNTNDLVIKNLEHLNQLVVTNKKSKEENAEATNKLRKETEELINTTLSLNDANRQAGTQYIQLNKEIKSIREEQKKYAEDLIESYQNYVVKKIEEEIDAWEDAKKKAQESAQEKIDAIQSEIDRLQERNEQLKIEEERQERLIEIAKQKEILENVKKQKNVRIYQNGQWVWVADPNKVKEETDKLKDLQDDYAKWEAENARQAEIQRLQNQIKQIQTDLKTTENYYDNKIKLGQEFLEKYKKQWEEQKEEVTSYEALIEGLSGIEQSVYETRLQQLNDFVTAWNALVSSMMVPSAVGGSVNVEVSSSTTSSVGSYADGGVVDYTGLATVHGSPNAVETVFNAEQGKKLYDFVKNLPNKMNFLNVRLPQLNIPLSKNNTTSQTIENHYHFENLNIQANDPSEMFRKLNMLIEQYT